MWPQSKEQLSNLYGNGGRSSKTAKELWKLADPLLKCVSMLLFQGKISYVFNNPDHFALDMDKLANRT